MGLRNNSWSTVSKLGANLPPGGHLVVPGGIVVYDKGKFHWHPWADARNAAKHLQYTEQPLTPDNYSVQNINSVMIKKPLVREGDDTHLKRRIAWAKSWKREGQQCEQSIPITPVARGKGSGVLRGPVITLLIHS